MRVLPAGKKKRPQGSPKEENCRLICQEVSERVSGSVEIGHKFYMEWLVNRIRKSYGSNSRPIMFTVLDVALAGGLFRSPWTGVPQSIVQFGFDDLAIGAVLHLRFLAVLPEFDLV